ncbi:hypothetical protein TMEC54S_00767 [Thauera mechernichensis]
MFFGVLLMIPAICMLSFFAIGLAAALATNISDPFHIEWAARLLFIFAVLPGLFLAVRDARPHWRTTPNAPNPERLRAKRVSLMLCLLAPLLYSALLASIGLPFYGAFLWDYLFILPVLILALPAYIRWSDAKLPEPEDGYASLGRALLGRQPWVWRQHKPLILAWTVKMLFIPVMYGSLQLMLFELLLLSPSLNPFVLVLWSYTFGLTFDLIIATIGYLCTSRLLATDVRSTDDTWSGWLVCMICYPPLWVILHAIREQADDVTWNQWLSPDQALYWVWAILIVLSWGLYWLSTASFGVRFSNLTYRGLIAHGPYRYTKHPSYIGKNVYWWLHTVPFIGVVGFGDLSRNLLGLGFVSLIYYLRAKTEERHLSRFPEYREYSSWIDEHGIFARCRRWVAAARLRFL